MNARIKELLAQSTKEIWGNDPYNGSHVFEGYEVDQEKFAELLIKECTQTLEDNLPMFDCTEWGEAVMNERIKELYNQCFVELKNDTPNIGFDFEKFAKLIVEECVEQLELVRKYRYDRVQPLENQQTIIDECQYQIKQHFGVE